MGDLQKFLKSLDPPKPSIFAFNSCQSRKTVTSFLPPTRMGLNLVPFGDPDLGPGKYDLLEQTSFITEAKKRVANKNGYCVRTAPRFPHMHDKNFSIRPISYIGHSFQTNVKQAKKPFGIGQTIHAVTTKEILDETPGPGSYIKEILKIPKKIKHGRFGGRNFYEPPVKLKCMPVNNDQCNQCGKKPMGVYYQKDLQILCRSCYKILMNTFPEKEVDLKSFKKVRDCSFFHDHSGPYDAATWVQLPNTLKKLQKYEIYFNQYE